MAERTPFSGLLRLEPQDSLSLDGYDFQTDNPRIIDALLKIGALLHKHDEHAAVAKPGVAAKLTLSKEGGSFASNLEVFVGYTLTDSYGGETAISPVAMLSTGEGFPNPTEPPSLAVEYTAGALLAATYTYGVTVTDGKGGESAISPVADAVVNFGFANAQVKVGNLAKILTNVAKGAVGAEWRLWRIQNASEWAFIVGGTAETYTDNGTAMPNCNVAPPETNTGLSANKITIEIPNPANPAVSTFTVYASLGEEFLTPSKVGTYPIAEVAKPIVLTSLAVTAGVPPVVSRSIAGATKINPDTDMVKFPWKRPVKTELELPTEGNEEGDIREVTELAEIFAWNNVTKKWVQISGGTSFSVENEAGEVQPTEKHLQLKGNAVAIEDDPVHERTVVTLTRGTIVEWLGNWDNAVSYVPGDVTVREGSGYISLVAGTNHDPLIVQGALSALGLGAKETAEKPLGIAISPDGKGLYACNNGSASVSQFSRSVETGALTALEPTTVAAGTEPYKIVISPAGTFAYVTDSGANTVSAYSRNTGTSALGALGTPTYVTGKKPRGIAMSPDGLFLYIANEEDATVSQYSRNNETGALAPLTPATIATGTSPRGIALSADGKHLYVADKGAKTLSLFSRNEGTGLLTALEPKTAATGEEPVAVTVSPDGKHVYVVNEGGKSVSPFSRNTTTGALTALEPATVEVETKPTDVAVSPDNVSVYVTGEATDKLSEFSRNTTSGKLTSIGTIATGKEPARIAVSPDSKFVYASDFAAKALSPFTRALLEYWGLVAKEGAAGPTGPAGPGPLKWMGAWSSATTYKENDAVSEGGSSYFSIANANLNHQPSGDGEVHWATLAKAGSFELYNGSAELVPAEPKLEFKGAGVEIKHEAEAGKNVVEVHKTFRSIQTFLVQGAVAAEAIPGFFVSKATNETLKLVKARFKLESGTEVKFRLQKNGANIAGFGTAEAPLVATSTEGKSATPMAVEVAEDDLITLLISSVAGSPVGLSVTVVLEHTV